jgi:ubiquitin-protein ligase
MDTDFIDLSADNGDARSVMEEMSTVATGVVGLSSSGRNVASKPPAATTKCDDGILEVWGGDTPLKVPAPARKKRRKHTHNAVSMAQVEAIDMTGSSAAASLKQTPEEKRLAEYKQILGPVRMEFVSDENGDAFLKTHSFNADDSSGEKSMGQIKTRKWHSELVQYAINLPVTPQGSIFVRVHESRLDLVRALITGPEDTPYQNGCFFFDFHMRDYPTSPPNGNLLTTGGGTVRFNPNLYNCGKICLSLLGTWEGPGWMPNKSTFLQVLVSIQGLILVHDPYFNEPGFERSRKTMQPHSDAYNKNIRKETLKWAIEDPLRRSLDMLEGNDAIAATSGSGTRGKKEAVSSTTSPQGYPEFALVVVMHFVQKAEEIETQLQEWTTLDPSLMNQAKTIRSLIQRALQQNVVLPFQKKPTKAAAAALKGKGSAKKPPPGTEVIELL